jgi:hypothetical protein
MYILTFEKPMRSQMAVNADIGSLPVAMTFTARSGAM